MKGEKKEEDKDWRKRGSVTVLQIISKERLSSVSFSRKTFFFFSVALTATEKVTDGQVKGVV